MADIFISYDRDDTDKVERIAEGLSQENVAFWWDRDLREGENFSLAIEDKIEEVRYVLVTWSSSARKSIYVRGEALEALDRGKLVQVVIDKSRLPVPFNAVQATFLDNWNGDRTDNRWRRLVSGIRGEAPVATHGDTGPTAPLSRAVELTGRAVTRAGVSGVQRAALWLMPMMLAGLILAAAAVWGASETVGLPDGWPEPETLFLSLAGGFIAVILLMLILLVRTLMSTLEAAPR